MTASSDEPILNLLLKSSEVETITYTSPGRFRSAINRIEPSDEKSTVFCVTLAQGPCGRGATSVLMRLVAPVAVRLALARSSVGSYSAYALWPGAPHARVALPLSSRRLGRWAGDVGLVTLGRHPTVRAMLRLPVLRQLQYSMAPAFLVVIRNQRTKHWEMRS